MIAPATKVLAVRDALSSRIRAGVHKVPSGNVARRVVRVRPPRRICLGHIGGVHDTSLDWSHSFYARALAIVTIGVCPMSSFVEDIASCRQRPPLLLDTTNQALQQIDGCCSHDVARGHIPS